MFRILRLIFHIVGVILSAFLLFVKEPGFSESDWPGLMICCLIFHAALLIYTINQIRGVE